MQVYFADLKVGLIHTFAYISSPQSLRPHLDLIHRKNISIFCIIALIFFIYLIILVASYCAELDCKLHRFQSSGHGRRGYSDVITGKRFASVVLAARFLPVVLIEVQSEAEEAQALVCTGHQQHQEVLDDALREEEEEGHVGLRRRCEGAQMMEGRRRLRPLPDRSG